MQVVDTKLNQVWSIKGSRSVSTPGEMFTFSFSKTYFVELSLELLLVGSFELESLFMRGL